MYAKLYRLKMFLSRLMYGRYGIDELFYGLFAVYLVLSITNAFLESSIVYLMGLAVIVYMFFRVFSRNIAARRRENDKFKPLWLKIKRLFTPKPYDPYHVFKKCPFCKTKLRLPRKAGKHTVCCPRCHRDFNIRVR